VNDGRFDHSSPALTHSDDKVEKVCAVIRNAVIGPRHVLKLLHYSLLLTRHRLTQHAVNRSDNSQTPWTFYGWLVAPEMWSMQTDYLVLLSFFSHYGLLLFYVLLCTLCTSLHLLTRLFCIYYYYCCCTVCTALLFSYSAIFIDASVRNKLIHSSLMYS